MSLRQLTTVVVLSVFSLALPATALADAPTAPGASSAPAAQTKETTATITLNGVVDGATVECSLDSSDYSVAACGFGDVPNQVVLTGLADGVHALSVRQSVTPGEYSAPLTVSWRVDTTGPDAPSVLTPGDGQTTGSSFDLNLLFEAGARLQCKLDPDPSADWENCPGIGDGTTYTVGWNTYLHWGETPNDPAWASGVSSADGSDCTGGYSQNRHVCWLAMVGSGGSQTTAKDLLGGGDPDGCSSTTSFLSGRQLVLGSLFGMSGDLDADLPNYNRFNLDCTATNTQVSGHLTGLSAGSHTLLVRAIDSLGNAGSEASVNWSVANNSAQSQADADGNVFINADVLEFGAKANGSFGTEGVTPAGFHERTENRAGPDGRSNGLGFVAPANPVTKDWSNPLGDFFTPGGPYEGWRLSANGQVAANHNDSTTITGAWDEVDSGDHSVTWRSTSSWQGLDVVMNYSTPGTDQLIQGTVTITNSSDEPVTGVAFARGVDPDNCVMDRRESNPSSINPYDTTNTIFSQWGVDDAAISVITAAASCNNETLLSLSSSDTGSRVGIARGEDWASDGDPLALLADNGDSYAVTPGEVVAEDADINIAIPTNPGLNNVLTPGVSVTLHFTYSLSRPALTSLGVSEQAPPRLTARPPAFSSSQSAVFNFEGSDSAVGFECRVDASAWMGCPSPFEVTDLADGPHQVSLREVDAGSNKGPTTVVNWTVDTEAPVAPQLSGGSVGDTTSTASTVTITGESNAVFSCSMDGGDFAPCSSPVELRDLTLGDHTLQVKQTDRAGNTSSTAGVAWKVVLKPEPPVIKGAPYVATQSAFLNLRIATDEGTTVSCSIDEGLFSPCGTLVLQPGPREYAFNLTNLNVGEHSLAVRASTAGGILSDVASVSWRVGLTTSPLVFGKAPTVTTTKNSGRWTVKLNVSSGADRRPASQPLTVQLATDPSKPADNLTPPKTATYGGKVVKYAATFIWNGKVKPRWLRVGNRAGRWSNWQAIASK